MLVKLQRPPPEISIFLPARSASSSAATRRPRFPASEAQNSPAAPAPKTTTSNRRLIVNRHCLRFRARKCTDVVGNEQLRRHHNALIKGGNLPITGEGKTSQELTGQRKSRKNGSDEPHQRGFGSSACTLETASPAPSNPTS